MLIACGKDSTFTQEATTENVSRSASVYALTGSSPELPAAYDMFTESYVRPILQIDGTVNFTIAFDINSAGKVVLLPVRQIVPLPPFPVGGTVSIGLEKSQTSYDLITYAASGGYTQDSTQIASVGDTYLMRLGATGCAYGEPYYGKLIVDSIIVAERRMVVRTLTNRNCGGYRSLAAGLPKD
ncbi:MAG: hypothetical protein ABJB66_07465 [Gemmatimonadaceae bacterium]